MFSIFEESSADAARGSLTHHIHCRMIYSQRPEKTLFISVYFILIYVTMLFIIVTFSSCLFYNVSSLFSKQAFLCEYIQQGVKEVCASCESILM